MREEKFSIDKRLRLSYLEKSLIIEKIEDKL